MPEPISLNVSVYPRPNPRRSGTAVSDEAVAIRKSVRAIEEKTERSFALFGRKAAAISEIWSLFAEHGHSGWDGDDAAPLSRAAAMLAVQLIRALPPDIPLPDFACEPDGSISLDWLLSRTRVFSLTAGMTDRLAYAWLDGTDRGQALHCSMTSAFPTGFWTPFAKWSRRSMLPSGLPEVVGDAEELTRFLTSSTHFNATSVKPSGAAAKSGGSKEIRLPAWSRAS